MSTYQGTAYEYDANGAMSAVTPPSPGVPTAIRYDPAGRPIRVDQGGATMWRAAYDGDGARRKRLDASGTVHYAGPYERNVGNGLDTTEVVTKYYHALGRLIAFRKNGVLYWAGTDHLGGTVRVADAT